ncbi:MAG: DUF1127 domain-containing protein [Oleiphilaceae bacterium]|nr:DUF1127 domain-containing protein [Oleiphilaceae bacterium]
MNKSIVLHQTNHLIGVSLVVRIQQRFALWRQEWRHVSALILLWQRRARTRRQLRAMNDHLLKDIGLSRYEAEAEGRKHFWRS